MKKIFTDIYTFFANLFAKKNNTANPAKVKVLPINNDLGAKKAKAITKRQREEINDKLGNITKDIQDIIDITKRKIDPSAQIAPGENNIGVAPVEKKKTKKQELQSKLKRALAKDTVDGYNEAAKLRDKIAALDSKNKTNNA